MQSRGIVARVGSVLALAAALCGAPAAATTLVRASVEDLVAANQTVVVGQVVDVFSYWNVDGTFILTDVIVRPDQVLKGSVEGELTITQMGGTVGDMTTLILGGPELIPGHSYVLFLNEENLPGAEAVTTVRDHCQGVFEIRVAEDGELRAISQANSHPLVPDRQGYLDAPGGIEGFTLEVLAESVVATAQRLQNEKEDNR